MGRKVIVIILILGAVLMVAVAGVLVLGLGLFATTREESVSTSPGPALTSGPTTTGPTTTGTTLGVADLSEEESAAMFEGAIRVFVSLAADTQGALTVPAEADSPTNLAVAEVSARAVAAQGAAERACLLIDEYRDVYGGYAYEALPTLSDLDDLLARAAEGAAAVKMAAESGATAPVGPQIEAAIAELAARVVKVEGALVAWEAAIAIERDSLRTGAISTEPIDVALDRTGVVERLESYLAIVTAVLKERSISRPELEAVFQAGANAAYSLRATGGWPVSLEDDVVGLTALIAAGELPAAGAALPSLQTAIDQLAVSG
jgi:hypothetical protein